MYGLQRVPAMFGKDIVFMLLTNRSIRCFFLISLSRGMAIWKSQLSVSLAKSSAVGGKQGQFIAQNDTFVVTNKCISFPLTTQGASSHPNTAMMNSRFATTWHIALSYFRRHGVNVAVNTIIPVFRDHNRSPMTSKCLPSMTSEQVGSAARASAQATSDLDKQVRGFPASQVGIQVSKPGKCKWLSVFSTKKVSYPMQDGKNKRKK